VILLRCLATPIESHHIDITQLLFRSGSYKRTLAAADYLGIGQSTLERKRIDGSGPRWRRLGAKIVVYATEDLDAWAAQQIHTSTSEPRHAEAA
jgi:predicted DNA-binding transcriptional regulator AlpA